MRLRSMLAALCVIGLAATTAVPADAAGPKNGYLVFSQQFTTLVTQSPNAGSYVFLTNGMNPKYSPDGQRLAYARDEEAFPGAGFYVERLYIRDLARGLETVVAEFSQDITERSPDWAPDGASLVYTEGRSLNKLVIATGVRSVIWSSGSLNVFQPSYAPDGSRIAFVTQPPGGSGSAIVTIKPDGTGLHTVMAGVAGVHNEFPDWSPNSAKLAFVTDKYDQSHNEIVTLPRNGSGTPLRVSHLSHPTTHELAGVAWSPNGQKIAGLEAYPDYLPGGGPFDERRVVRGYAPDGSSSAALTGPITGDGTGNPPGLDWAPKVS